MVQLRWLLGRVSLFENRVNKSSVPDEATRAWCTWPQPTDIMKDPVLAKAVYDKCLLSASLWRPHPFVSEGLRGVQVFAPIKYEQVHRLKDLLDKGMMVQSDLTHEAAQMMLQSHVAAKPDLVLGSTDRPVLLSGLAVLAYS